MSASEIALWYALFKIYDNYITPLNSRIHCWKTKWTNDMVGIEDWFLIVMEIRQFTGGPKYLIKMIPIDWWDKFNVMVLDKAPASVSEEIDLIKELLEL